FAVGGVTPENLAQWIDAGCAGAGLGSDLYRAGQSVERTAQQAAAFVKAYREAVQSKSPKLPRIAYLPAGCS
ncbi:hypothetical protein ACAG12_26370, partial [Escherichia coli]